MKATVTVIPPPPPPQGEVTLVMTTREAEILCSLVGIIGGAGLNEAGHFVSHLYEALRYAGVKNPVHESVFFEVRGRALAAVR